jgi:superfamily I DNA/RNA helicase
MSLNPDQLQAVECDDHCLVVACPGSGKTHLVVKKISRILKNPATRIVAVTFTRDGANEMKVRVEREVGADAMSRCYISTFHSLALMHLKREKVKVRIAKNAEIEDFVIRAIATANLDMDTQDAMRAIELCKTTPNYEPLNDPVGKLYCAYTDIAKRSGVMDFFDVMLLSLNMIKDGSLPILGATDMIVDEFQDVDEVQFQYMMEHYRRGNIRLTAVGDDDQTIFKFRHALGYEGMCRFEKETGATRVTLGINYRCHREILTSADRLILQNRNRMEKRLFANKGRGGQVETFRYGDRRDEANAVAERILSTLPANSVPNSVLQVRQGQWAVLARNNSQLDEIDAKLSAKGIPFYRSGSSFWDRPLPANILTMLQSLLTGERAGIEVCLHWAGVPPGELDLLHEMLEDDFGNLYLDTAEKMLAVERFDPLVKPVVVEFVNNIRGWAKSAKNKNEDRNNGAIHGLTKWMLSRTNRHYEIKQIEIAASVLKEMPGSLATRLNNIQRKMKDKDGNGVALSTMHSSKGLEFDNVWIIGAEESIIPASDDGIPTIEDTEEERKLMYVAMTRARNCLIVSSTANNQPSRFLAEAFRN